MNARDDKLSPQDIADEYRVPLQTVYAWRTKGIGPRGAKIGKHVRYRRADVDEWFERQLTPAPHD